MAQVTLQEPQNNQMILNKPTFVLLNRLQTVGPPLHNSSSSLVQFSTKEEFDLLTYLSPFICIGIHLTGHGENSLEKN